MKSLTFADLPHYSYFEFVGGSFTYQKISNCQYIIFGTKKMFLCDDNKEVVELEVAGLESKSDKIKVYELSRKTLKLKDLPNGSRFTLEGKPDTYLKCQVNGFNTYVNLTTAKDETLYAEAIIDKVVNQK